MCSSCPIFLYPIRCNTEFILRQLWRRAHIHSIDTRIRQIFKMINLMDNHWINTNFLKRRVAWISVIFSNKTSSTMNSKHTQKYYLTDKYILSGIHSATLCADHPRRDEMQMKHGMTKHLLKLYKGYFVKLRTNIVIRGGKTI